MTNDEENALRYATGDVIRSTHRKIDKAHHSHKNAMLTILNQLKDDRGDSNEESYISYTKLWIKKVNRGGLFFSNSYFIRCYGVCHQGLFDPDVQFHWCHLTSNNEEIDILHRLICQWLTIRGFLHLWKITSMLLSKLKKHYVRNFSDLRTPDRIANSA